MKPIDFKRVWGWIGVCVGALIVLIIVLVLTIWGFKAFGRSQERAQKNQDRQQAQLDAKNKVHVSAIEIRNQAQRVKVTEQQAEIRQKQAVGVREAQDEIAKTLTPLYVQFEMTQALQAIAKSGRNSSVVYIPSGAGGIPLVSTVNPDAVTAP